MLEALGLQSLSSIIYIWRSGSYTFVSQRSVVKNMAAGAFNDVKRVILHHNFMKYTTDRLRTVGKPINSTPWL